MPTWLKLEVLEKEYDPAEEQRAKLGIDTKSEDVNWQVYPYQIDLDTIRIKDFQALYFREQDLTVVSFTDGTGRLVTQKYSDFIKTSLEEYNTKVERIELRLEIAESFLADKSPQELKAMYADVKGK